MGEIWDVFIDAYGYLLDNKATIRQFLKLFWYYSRPEHKLFDEYLLELKGTNNAR